MCEHNVHGGNGSRARPRRLLTLAQVMEQTGLSRALIYDLMAKDLFPRCVRAAARAVRWWEDELDDWMEDLPRATPANLR